MNKDKLTSICHKISQKTNLSFNEVMTYYFLEQVLAKLAGGKYADNLVFKGGFLLSNVVGLDTRSTVDIDFLIRNSQLSKENILNILNDAFAKNDGNIDYEIKSIKPIKENDNYGGFRVNILCKLENIKLNVPLDIATGDVVTPCPIRYQYKSVFFANNIMIKAYPIETMIAEKLQTIFSRGFLNSRSKDYYDLHILYRVKQEEIDFKIQKEAIENTFNHRDTQLDYRKIKNLLEDLKVDKDFIKRWKSYQNKNTYVDADLETTINSILELIKKLLFLGEN